MISLPPNAAYLLQVTYSTKSHSQGPSLSTRSVKPFSTDSTLPTSLASSFTPHKLWPCWITYSPITVLHVLTNPWLCTHCILYTLFSAQNIPFLYLFLAWVTLISKSQLRDSFWGGFNKTLWYCSPILHWPPIMPCIYIHLYRIRLDIQGCVWFSVIVTST